MHSVALALCLMLDKQHSTWKAAAQGVCLVSGSKYNMHQQRVWVWLHSCRISTGIAGALRAYACCAEG